MADLSVSSIQNAMSSSASELSHSAAVNERIGEFGAAGTQGVADSGDTSGGKGGSFMDILKDSVEKVNLYQTEADTAVKEMVAGRNKNIHETMLAIERADTSLKLMMQVRNKIIDAYKEIMRMQV